jgi:predicted small metal-binding protein
MQRFRCGEVVPGCAAEFAGDAGEILSEMDEHVRVEHGLPELPPEMDRAIRTHLRADFEPPRR